MGLVSKPYTFSAGEVVVAAQHNDNFDTLYTLVNGNFSTANLSASAVIVDTQLAQITTANKVALTALTTTGNYTSTSGTFSFVNIDVDGTAEVDAITLNGNAVDTAGGLGTYTTLVLKGIKDYGTSTSSSTAKAQKDLYIVVGNAGSISSSGSVAITNLPFTSNTSYYVATGLTTNGVHRIQVTRDSGAQCTFTNNDGSSATPLYIMIGT